MGRKKCEYCIDFRNMHTAIHGLIVFNSRKEAEKAYTDFTYGVNRVEQELRLGSTTRENSEDLYNSLVDDLFVKSINVYDEINFREIKEEMSPKYLKYYRVKSCIIVNIVSLDIYM